LLHATSSVDNNNSAAVTMSYANSPYSNSPAVRRTAADDNEDEEVRIKEETKYSFVEDIRSEATRVARGLILKEQDYNSPAASKSACVSVRPSVFFSRLFALAVRVKLAAAVSLLATLPSRPFLPSCFPPSLITTHHHHTRAATSTKQDQDSRRCHPPLDSQHPGADGDPPGPAPGHVDCQAEPADHPAVSQADPEEQHQGQRRDRQQQQHHPVEQPHRRPQG
jgi:hypothetical protein